MTAPMVSISGTPVDVLMDGFLEATDALQAAIQAVNALPLNQRDFYQQEPGAWNSVLAQQAAMLAQLNAMRAELYAVVETLAG